MHHPAVLEESSFSMIRHVTGCAGVGSWVVSSIMIKVGGCSDFALYGTSATVEGTPPGVAVCCKLLPVGNIDAHRLQVTFGNVLKPQLLSANFPLSIFQLSIQKLSGYPFLAHSGDMASPAQLHGS